MDLVVLANGTNRSVSGVTEATTCSQIVYVLATAIHQKGRFVLVAKFNGTEYRLSQNEKPLDIIKKCQAEGYPVNFELRQLPSGVGPPTAPKPSPMPSSSSVDSEISNITSKSFQQVHLISSSYSTTVHPSPVPHVYSIATASCSALPPNPIPKPSISHNISLPVLRKPVRSGPPGAQHRPPPPSYEEVVTAKFNSLSRESSKSLIAALHNPTASNGPLGTAGPGPTRATPVPNHASSLGSITDEELARMSPEELERIAEQQAKVIAAQKMQLSELERSITDPLQLEYFQLTRQDNNLQMVLLKLIDENWALKYDQAKREELDLSQRETSLHLAMAERNREIDEALQRQHRLEAELRALQQEIENEEMQNLAQYQIYQPEPSFDAAELAQPRKLPMQMPSSPSKSPTKQLVRVRHAMS